MSNGFPKFFNSNDFYFKFFSKKTALVLSLNQLNPLISFNNEFEKDIDEYNLAEKKLFVEISEKDFNEAFINTTKLLFNNLNKSPETIKEENEQLKKALDEKPPLVAFESVFGKNEDVFNIINVKINHNKK